jgi:hypothetical protein
MGRNRHKLAGGSYLTAGRLSRNGEDGLLATASLAHNLHHDFVQIGAGGVQGVDAAH